jgi:hypothetical protein
MPNESKTPEEYLSDALDLMGKAKWIKQYGPSAKGFEVDWTDRGKLAMEALGYVIEDLGPENFNQQLWWAVGTLANMEFTSQSWPSAAAALRSPMHVCEVRPRKGDRNVIETHEHAGEWASP